MSPIYRMGMQLEQIAPETCDMDIGPVPEGKAQEDYTAYHELDFKRATETKPDWAPTPVKVVGPEPEPHELYFHEQALEGIKSGTGILRLNSEPAVSYIDT